MTAYLMPNPDFDWYLTADALPASFIVAARASYIGFFVVADLAPDRGNALAPVMWVLNAEYARLFPEHEAMPWLDESSADKQAIADPVDALRPVPDDSEALRLALGLLGSSVKLCAASREARLDDAVAAALEAQTLNLDLMTGVRGDEPWAVADDHVFNAARSGFGARGQRKAAADAAGIAHKEAAAPTVDTVIAAANRNLRIGAERRGLAGKIAQTVPLSARQINRILNAHKDRLVKRGD